ncbi:MAG: glycosyltransferase family 2 protein [Patescibacteria group bacterium]|nr:glycosyltransferase family 2 protein [Patescibacteria group bacterium]
MTKKPKVSLIVLAYNGIDLTLEVLECISKLEVDGLNVETVVVDNASKDETFEKLKDYKLSNMPFKIIRNEKNLGFAGGNNVGIIDAIERKADYIILLNNDIYFTKEIVKVVVNEVLKDKKIGLISPKMYFAKGYEFHKERYKKEDLGKVIWYAGGIIDKDNVYSSHRGVDEIDKGQYDKQEETDYASGAFVLLNSKLLKEIGLLDDKLFLYWEDADLSQRAKMAGWKVIYTSKTKLWHKVSVAAGGPGGETNDYFLTRNRLVYGFRYMPLRTKFALIRDSIRLFILGRKWQKKGVIDFYLNRLGKGSRIK